VEVVIVPSAVMGGELIAESIASLLQHTPDALLGVATGSTPLPVYESLAGKVRSGAVDASRARVCQLDEYVGLPPGHPESYRSVVMREVVRPLGLPEENFMGPDGFAEDVGAPPKVAARLVRFEAVRRRLGSAPLARLAADGGFADQAHLSREFAALAGAPPTAFPFVQDGDGARA